MKAAARSLKTTADHPATALIAIRDAIRVDADHLYQIWHRDKSEGRIDIDARLTWVSGCIGSGKPELTYAAARNAARNGYRVITVTTDNNYPYRWRRDERVVIDLRKSWPHSCETYMSELKSQLADPAIINLAVLVPELLKLSVEETNPILQLRQMILDNLPDHCLFVMDDLFYFHPLPPVLPQLQSALHRTGSRAIVSSQDVPEGISEQLTSDDCHITMRLLHPSGLEKDHSTLREGIGFLHIDGEVLPIEGDYEFDLYPNSVFSEQAREVITRLEHILSREGILTHIGRLEAVARACGYRSWHAAQGRRSGAT
jgi:hypothetical protein